MADKKNKEIKNDLKKEAAEDIVSEKEALEKDKAESKDGSKEDVIEQEDEEKAEAAASDEDVKQKAESGENESSGEDETGAERSFEKKDKKDEKIEELTDRLTRQIAEFDNYRKRTEKEKAANYVIGAKDIIEKLLPVIDNFERGLADADLSDPFAEGMDKIYKQFTSILKDVGVEPIEAVGCEFDPNLHNAVMHVEDESASENIVLEEFQKGYTYKDYVVRHSMVKVAN